MSLNKGDEVKLYNPAQMKVFGSGKIVKVEADVYTVSVDPLGILVKYTNDWLIKMPEDWPAPTAWHVYQSKDQIGPDKKSTKVEPSLIPPYALTQIAEVLTKGKQKHPDEKWKVLSIKDHVDATLRHMLAYLRGEWNEEEQCNHLVNAACRLLFAIEKLPKDKSE